NIAPSVFKNNVVLENGCHYENKLRNVLLRTFEGNVNDADRLKSFIAAFNALGWEEKNQRPFVPKETESLNVMLARFVQERWNHMLDATGQTPNNVEFVAKADWSAKKVLDAIKDLPISIISVVSPNADDKGGGLHLDANGYFQVVDKSHYKDAGQEKTKNFKMYFNPMDFAILTTKDLPEDFEDGLIFVSDKEYGQPSIKIRQGESASTHLVSNPAKVLSRFVITPEKERNDIFLPSKTIDATNSSNLRTANEQLERDMLWFAVRRLRKIHSQTNGQDEIYGLIRRTLEDIDQKGYENENMSKDDEAALNALRACKNFAANEKAIEKARKDIELNEEIIEKAKDRGTDKNSVEKAKKNIEANKDVIEKAEKYLKENKEKIEEEKKRLKDYANSVYERIRGSDGRELPFIEEIVVREQRRLFYTRINFDQEAIGRRPFLKTVNNTGKELLELLKYVSMQAAQLGLPLEECIRMLGYTGKFLSNIYRDYSSRKVESADAANDSTGSGGGNPQGQNKEQE
ncbi:MAG: hypothetical protein LBD99_05260, partial [Candidatus Margulisbacteria bacterium]|nr:hypothetical protein [Candidatus Margulisiibacteriota bacterium]